MMDGKCNNFVACSQTNISMIFAFAKTIHIFQRAGIAKTALERPDNIYHRIIADLGAREAEARISGLLYTLLSKVTSLVDEDKPKTSDILMMDQEHDRRERRKH